MKYKFKYKPKNSLFWKCKIVVGHSLEFFDEKIYNSKNELIQTNRKFTNAMVIYFEDGSLERISEWDKCDMLLGTDWKLAIKKSMENEIGQDIKLSI